MNRRPNLANKLIARLTSVGLARLIGEPVFRTLGRRSKYGDLRLAEVKSVAVIRLDEIGDVVLLSPLLRELRRMLPEAWITLVVKPSVFALVELCPHVNEVLTFEWQVQPPAPANPIALSRQRLRRHLRVLGLAVTKLWRRRFDLTIAPRRSEDTYHGNFLAYFSGARWRVGYSERVTSDAPPPGVPYFDQLLTHPLQNAAGQHEVRHNLDVLRAIGGRDKDDSLELWLAEDDRHWADGIYRAHAIGDGDRVVGLCLGGGNERRRWPDRNYYEVLSWFLRQFTGYVIVVGGAREHVSGARLRDELGPRVINLAGTASLRQTAAVLSRCSIYLGNDTGPMHLAAAMKVPIVEISCHPQTGSRVHVNSPVRFGPWEVPAIVLQPDHPRPPCSDYCQANAPHCITQVRVEDVQAAVLQLLAIHPATAAAVK